MGEATHDLQKDIEALKSDLSKLRGDLRSVADELFVRGKQSAKAAGEAVASRVGSSMESVQHCVEERPLTCVLTAFAAGIVLGKLANLGRH